MKASFQGVAGGALLAALIASSVSCYPVYPPPNQGAYSDAKGYIGPQGPDPAAAPPRYAVDPAVAVAGVAAAGLLGYALGQNHGHHYYGPYYGPVPYRYGYYGPPCYR
jgi:hypothetical protein